VSRAIPLLGPHVCDFEWCSFPCPLNPENIKTRKERREARRYAAKQVRRARRRSKP
jgi:hypothetical protein